MVNKKRAKQDEFDIIEATIVELIEATKEFRNEEVYVALQDCVKKIDNIKRDHGN